MEKTYSIHTTSNVISVSILSASTYYRIKYNLYHKPVEREYLLSKLVYIEVVQLSISKRMLLFLKVLSGTLLNPTTIIDLKHKT